MDLLITVIGNAAVDPHFRKRFLENPIDTLDHYGIRLTKGDFEMMEEVFTKLDPRQKAAFEEAFSLLEKRLYERKICPHPCRWSIYPPPEFRSSGAKKVA
ncbi:MAG TPA: hypothetical protein VMG82_37925 [Candidatus Sulfotelmatobacter sp.]|nr:hypothetical protein [Candidatus Sulfotelmatobacter sp.]